MKEAKRIKGVQREKRGLRLHKDYRTVSPKEQKMTPKKDQGHNERSENAGTRDTGKDQRVLWKIQEMLEERKGAPSKDHPKTAKTKSMLE